MKLADHAEVMRFEDAAPGNLLVGRMRTREAYYVAIRAQPLEGQRDNRPATVVLSRTLERKALPFYSPLREREIVLNLGWDWFVDVALNNDQPLVGQVAENTVLIRVGTIYYIRLQEANFLDLSTGDIEMEPPYLNRPHLSWDAFDIQLNVPGKEEGERIYSWP